MWVPRCFHYLFVFSFLSSPPPPTLRSSVVALNLAIISDAFNRRMVVPFADFGSGESGQRRDTYHDGPCALRAGFILSGLLCRLPVRWFVAQAICGL